MGRLIRCFVLAHFVFVLTGESFAQQILNPKELPAIQINDKKRHFIDRNDTIIYDAKAFINKEVHKVKDLLTAMPGFTVDPTGRVMFNGKEIKYVMINGNDLTGNKYETITKNLQAGLIRKVELIKRYHENRLLTGIEYGDEQAVNLVIDESKTYHVNLQHSMGSSTDFKRKESDGNLISVYRKTSTLAVYDLNNHGRIPNGQGASDVIQNIEPKLFMFPNAFSSNNASPLIPERYVHVGSGKGFVLDQMHKLNHYLTNKIHFTVNTENLKQDYTYAANYTIPEMVGWEHRDFHTIGLLNKTIKGDLEFKYDDLKNHVSTYNIQFVKNGYNRSVEQYTFSPVLDSMYTMMKGNTYVLSGNAYESFRFRNTCVFVGDLKFLSSTSGNHFYQSSSLLHSLPDVFNGTKEVGNFTNAQEHIFQGGIKAQFNNRKHYLQIGWKFQAQLIRSSSQIHAIKLNNSILENFSSTFYQTKRWSIYANYDHDVSRRFHISSQSAFGMANAFWDQKRSAFTGQISTSFNYTQRAFRNTSMLVNLSKGLPDKNIFHASPVLNEQMQWRYGSTVYSFPVKAGVRFLKTHTNLYNGFSYTVAVSGDKHFNTITSAAFHYPLYSIGRYVVGKTNDVLSLSGKFQKNVFLWMVKPYAEFQYSRLKQELYLNGVKSFSQPQISEYQFGMVSYWKTMLNLETSFIYKSMLMQTKPEKLDKIIHDQRYKFDLKIKCELSERIYASIYGMSLWGSAYMNTSYFMDAYLEHKISERAMLFLRVHNLFNQHDYIERMYEPYYSQVSSSSLLPRYLMISMQLNF